MDLTSQIITTAGELICMVVVLLVGRYVIPAIKASSNANKINSLINWAKTFVEAVEQVIGAGNGSLKKETVEDYLKTKAEELGVDINDIDLDSIIESAVYAMNEVKKESEEK